MYDAFELYPVAEIDDEGTCECLAGFDEPIPDDPGEPGFLDYHNFRRVFWTIYGHLPEGGVEALIDGTDLEHITKQFEFFKSLLERKM